MTPQEKAVLLIEIRNLQKQNELMKQLNSTNGFFDYFFKKLPEFQSRKMCFDAVNEEYYQLFGMYRYADYGVFRTTISRNYKK